MTIIPREMKTPISTDKVAYQGLAEVMEFIEEARTGYLAAGMNFPYSPTTTGDGFAEWVFGDTTIAVVAQSVTYPSGAVQRTPGIWVASKKHDQAMGFCKSGNPGDPAVSYAKETLWTILCMAKFQNTPEVSVEDVAA